MSVIPQYLIQCELYVYVYIKDIQIKSSDVHAWGGPANVGVDIIWCHSFNYVAMGLNLAFS